MDFRPLQNERLVNFFANVLVHIEGLIVVAAFRPTDGGGVVVVGGDILGVIAALVPSVAVSVVALDAGVVVDY